MVGEVTALSPDDYQQWLRGAGAFGSLATEGQKVFASMGCPTCHTGADNARGPNLYNLYGRMVRTEDNRTVVADESYIRESILVPGAKVVSGFQPVMPVFQGLVTEEQLNSLIAYVKSLNQAPSGAAGMPSGVPAGQPEQDSTGCRRHQAGYEPESSAAHKCSAGNAGSCASHACRTERS